LFKIKNRTKVLCLLGLITPVSSCNDIPSTWMQIEQVSKMVFYLDTSSVRRRGDVVEFEFIGAPSGWFERQMKDYRISKRIEMDCKQGTYRTHRGGLYEKGQLIAPHNKFFSGAIPGGGYLDKLRAKVC
jgi:hypothetical protein